MAEVGSLWVRLLGDTKGFEAAMKGLPKALEKTGQRFEALGDTMTRSVTLPLAVLGGASIAAAAQIEGAMAGIRAGTGATGEELAALGGDFRDVFNHVPENAQQVGTAITDLNARLGLTGEPLRNLTEQMLGLADLTGAQIAPLIATTTRVFGDWGVATTAQAGALDLLYKTSQATGLGVEQLSNLLVQFGAPLRAMNFSMEESAAMLGKWEKEGVNTELVLGSLRIAMGNFANENIPMREGLNQTIARIRELGPSAEATALAMEIFGARAGPDMAAAILEGRFAFDELLAQIQASPDTIAAADAATETFAEKLAILRNQATLAVEPIGTRLVEAITNLMPQITALLDGVTRLVEWFTQLDPGVQIAILGTIAFTAALGPLLAIVGNLISMTAGVISFFGSIKSGAIGAKIATAALTVKKTALATAFLVVKAAAALLAAGMAALKIALVAVKAVFLILTGPIGLVIAAVAALAAGAYFLIRNWDTVVGFFAGLASRIASALSGVVSAITAPFRQAMDIVSSITDRISGFLNRINPFARSSPSLVDNVRAGVAAIQNEYAKLERLQLPAVSAMMPQASTAGAALQTHSRTGNITIPVYLDGHMIARAVAPHLVDDIRTKTGVKF